ncbi:MAG: hypothetical protein QMC71_07170 [Gammaproteobacteria bacterium]|jgi:hypothetical protein|uniref:hypothetical protein n=1 Tax=unclassified Candidatus Njordibacter TaxID=3458427 RepID=UPI0023B52E2A|nr:MAG: Uncharacterised protein [Oceanospirillaceae bacterium UBA2001]|tara:strand:- start:2817 stop:3011 length:195 start_codon:yes stop_codon:yes gene_type:complete
MLEVLLQRSTVVSLAVIGGLLSLCVTVLASRGALSENAIKNLNKLAYGFMGLSMLLFIAAGLRN